MSELLSIILYFSGMLLTYTQLKQMKKLKDKFTAPKAAHYVANYYFHRYWR